MNRLRRQKLARLGAACIVGLLTWGYVPGSRAQDASTDDALDRLLEKVDPKSKVGPAKPAAGEKPTSAKTEKPESRNEEPARPKADQPKPRKTTDPAKVEDQELDSLLEKLGETKDQPKTAKKPEGPGAGEPGEMPPAPGGDGSKRGDQPEPDDGLSPDKKIIDEHLEELTGIRRKRGQDRKQDPNSGPMAQTVKKMRDVEKKLGEEDTGEETRGKQKEIVKDFDQLIAQAKQAGGSGSGKPQRSTQQAGNKPGGQGDKPGSTGSGVGAAMPKRPDAKSALANSKDEWGHLPPELRGEMENVFKEEALPARKTLIDRYYISVTRKSTGNRGD